MRIGIDIDETIAYTVKSMVKYADIYDKKYLGRNGLNGNFGLIQNRYYLKALYGWSDEQKFAFFDTYYKNVLEESEPMPDAIQVINALKKEGNEIYFITARLIDIKNCNTEEITRNMLEKNNIPYDKLIANASNKLEVCVQNHIDFFIDDSFDTCKELSENGIPSLLMNTKMNAEIDSGDIKRVYNWEEIEKRIHEIS